MNHLKRNAVIAVACCSVAVPLASQTRLDSLQQLPEVVITGQSGDRQLRSTAPHHILDGEQIRRLNSIQLSDAVKHLPGVLIRDYGGIGGLKTISVRSLGAHHTAVSYNGVTLTDQQTGQIDIGRFSLDNVEQLTLHNGEDDRIFRPARSFAAASALEITSARPRFDGDEKVNGKATLRGGSFGLINPSLLVNSRITQRVTATLSGEWMRSAGNYPYLLRYGTTAGDSTSRERRINGDVENLRLESSLHAQISERSRGNLHLYCYDSERGLPGATIYYNTLHNAGQRLWERQFFLQGRFEHLFSRQWELRGDGKYQQGYLHYFDPSYLGSSGKVDDIFRQYERYGSISALYRAFSNLSFAASSDLTSSTMHANRQGFVTPTRLTSQTVVATRWVSEKFQASASLLHTKTFESARNGEAGVNRRRLSPYLSASVRPFHETDLRLRAFYKKSFRLPTFTAEKRGGTCSILPVNCFRHSSTISRVMCPVGYTASTSVSRSKEGVVAPSIISAIYSLVRYCSCSISFVFLPVQMVMTPVASGSSVPACPTFSFFIFSFWHSFARTTLTNRNEVQCRGLSICKISPSIKSIRLCLKQFRTTATQSALPRR
jgi:vitamin B12 transporter